VTCLDSSDQRWEGSKITQGRVEGKERKNKSPLMGATVGRAAKKKKKKTAICIVRGGIEEKRVSWDSSKDSAKGEKTIRAFNISLETKTGSFRKEQKRQSFEAVQVD